MKGVDVDVDVVYVGVVDDCIDGVDGAVVDVDVVDVEVVDV